MEEFKKDSLYFYEGGNGNEIVITREKYEFASCNNIINKIEFLFCEDNSKHNRKVCYNSNGYYIIFQNNKYYCKNKTISI